MNSSINSQDDDLSSSISHLSFYEKTVNATALGLGVSLSLGGGVESLVLGFVVILAGVFVKRPTIPLVVAGFSGMINSFAIDITGLSAIPGIALAVGAGYSCWLGSNKLIVRLKIINGKTSRKIIFALLPLIYVILYFIFTIIMVMLLS